MQTRIIRAAAAATGFFWLSIAYAAPPATTRPVNPALLYWQSIGMLTEMTRNEMQLLYGHRNGNSWDVEKARALLGNQKAALIRFAKAGGSSAPCDWGFTMEEGPFMPLPHLGKMQSLCNLGLLKAACDFADGRTDDALKAVRAVRRAARHLGDGDLLVTSVAQYAIESEALALLGKHVLSLDDFTRQELLTEEANLSPLRTTSQAVSGERGFAAWAEQQATEVVTLMLLQNAGQAATGAPADPSTALPADHPYSTITPEVLNAWIAEMRTRYAEAEAALALPWSQSQVATRELQERLKSGNPLVRSIFPSLQAARDTQARTETHLIMLRLALQHGAALDATTAGKTGDAFDGQPLRWHKDDGGSMVLTAAQQVRGKPVALKIGPARQK